MVTNYFQNRGRNDYYNSFLAYYRIRTILVARGRSYIYCYPINSAYVGEWYYNHHCYYTHRHSLLRYQ